MRLAVRGRPGLIVGVVCAWGSEGPPAASLGGVTKRFEQAMRLMRRHDPQAKEDGFGLLLPHAAEHVEELVAEFAQEREDHGLRCWLLELIGEARSPVALPLLVQQVHSDDESLRSWAVRGLEQLDTKQAREQLWRARANGLIP
jgi:hypothetical protein